jgi:hypothetical protein
MLTSNPGLQEAAKLIWYLTPTVNKSEKISLSEMKEKSNGTIKMDAISSSQNKLIITNLLSSIHLQMEMLILLVLF